MDDKGGYKSEIEPPFDLWPGIRSRIKAQRLRRMRTLVVSLSAVAAIVLIVLYDRGSKTSVTQVAPATARTVMDSADATNDARVERELLDELELRRGELRPETEASVRANLQTIDSAITELRAEMTRRPNDPALAQLLAEAYAHKVDLMKLLANAS
jgi:hypothetical protein